MPFRRYTFVTPCLLRCSSLVTPIAFFCPALFSQGPRRFLGVEVGHGCLWGGYPSHHRRPALFVFWPRAYPSVYTAPGICCICRSRAPTAAAARQALPRSPIAKPLAPQPFSRPRRRLAPPDPRACGPLGHRRRPPAPAPPAHRANNPAHAPAIARRTIARAIAEPGWQRKHTRAHPHARTRSHTTTHPRTHAAARQNRLKSPHNLPNCPQFCPHANHAHKYNCPQKNHPPGRPHGVGARMRGTPTRPHRTRPARRPHARPDPRRPAPPMPPSQPHAPAPQRTPARTNAPRQPDAPPAPHTGAPHHTSTTRIQIQKERCTTRTHTHRTALQSSR